MARRYDKNYLELDNPRWNIIRMLYCLGIFAASIYGLSYLVQPVEFNVWSQSGPVEVDSYIRPTVSVERINIDTGLKYVAPESFRTDGNSIRIYAMENGEVVLSSKSQNIFTVKHNVMFEPLRASAISEKSGSVYIIYHELDVKMFSLMVFLWALFSMAGYLLLGNIFGPGDIPRPGSVVT
jgi:hypothetical protein